MNGKSRLPKLKIKLPSGVELGDILDIEQARELLDFEHAVFMIEGQTVHSYEELFALATCDDFRNKAFIEVVLLQAIEGG